MFKISADQARLSWTVHAPDREGADSVMPLQRGVGFAQANRAEVLHVGGIEDSDRRDHRTRFLHGEYCQEDPRDEEKWTVFLGFCEEVLIRKETAE